MVPRAPTKPKRKSPAKTAAKPAKVFALRGEGSARVEHAPRRRALPGLWRTPLRKGWLVSGLMGSPLALCLPPQEGPRQKKLQSCGKQATILPGGRGLVCPLEGCTVVGTEAEVLAHALKEHGIQGRVVGANGRTRCLWEGCGKCVKLSKQRDGSWNLGHVRQHERKHAPGPNPYVVPDTVLPGRENKTGRVPAIFRVPASAPSAAP